MTWYPHITVAAVAERSGKFLLVQERNEFGQAVINQPAGHLEEGESLVDAVIRETLEETGWHFKPQSLINFCLYKAPANQITYLRCNFSGRVLGRFSDVAIDSEIEQVLWLSESELQRRPTRSPMVLAAIRGYRTGQRYPLSLLQTFLEEHHALEI